MQTHWGPHWQRLVSLWFGIVCTLYLEHVWRWCCSSTFSEKLFMPFCRVIFHLFVLALAAVYDCAMQYLCSRLRNAVFHMHFIKICFGDVWNFVTVFFGAKKIRLCHVLYVSVKKETLKLQGFEKSLLNSYRIYLQRLEKLVLALNKKRGNVKAASEVKLKFEDVLCCIHNVKLQKCACIHLFVCNNVISSKFLWCLILKSFIKMCQTILYLHSYIPANAHNRIKNLNKACTFLCISAINHHLQEFRYTGTHNTNMLITCVQYKW